MLSPWGLLGDLMGEIDPDDPDVDPDDLEMAQDYVMECILDHTP